MPCVSNWLKDIRWTESQEKVKVIQSWFFLVKEFIVGFLCTHEITEYALLLFPEENTYLLLLKTIALNLFFDKYFNVKEDLMPHKFVLSFEKVIPRPSLKAFVKWHSSFSTHSHSWTLANFAYVKGPVITGSTKYIFLLINIMHCGVTWKLLVSYVISFNSNYQIVNALVHFNTGDLQKHLAWKQIPIIVWKS